MKYSALNPARFRRAKHDRRCSQRVAVAAGRNVINGRVTGAGFDGVEQFNDVRRGNLRAAQRVNLQMLRPFSDDSD